MAVGFTAHLLARVASKCSRLFRRASDSLSVVALELEFDEKEIAEEFARELERDRESLGDRAIGVCTRVHTCGLAGAGPCNGFPRSALPLPEEFKIDGTMPEHIQAGLRKQNEAIRRRNGAI